MSDCKLKFNEPPLKYNSETATVERADGRYNELRRALEEAREIILAAELPDGYDDIRADWLSTHAHLFEGDKGR